MEIVFSKKVKSGSPVEDSASLGGAGDWGSPGPGPACLSCGNWELGSQWDPSPK